MADLLVRNATLPDGRTGCDALVTDGRIVEVAPRISAAAVPVLDVEGYLLSPPFVDAHFQLDSALSYSLPRVNRSGTLLEGIAVWGERRPMLTQESLVERALAYCDWAVAKGMSQDQRSPDR
jgi:cytosine deaminase